MAEQSTNKPTAETPLTQNPSTGHSFVCILLSLGALLLAGTAYIWLPPILGHSSSLEQRVVKLEKEAHIPQDLSPLVKRITDLENKMATSNIIATNLSKESEEIYGLLTVERKLAIGHPFKNDLKALQELSGFEFSTHMHDIAASGIITFAALYQGFVRLARREHLKEQQQSADQSRPWVLMVKSWLANLVTIEPLNTVPKAYEPVVKALGANNLQAAVKALNALPHEHFKIWLSHAQGRLDIEKELQVYRENRMPNLYKNPVTQEMAP